MAKKPSVIKAYRHLIWVSRVKNKNQLYQQCWDRLGKIKVSHQWVEALIQSKLPSKIIQSYVAYNK